MMQVVLVVDVLDPRDGLVSDEKYCLERESTVAEVEQVFE